jgi:hypothetical protein
MEFQACFLSNPILRKRKYYYYKKSGRRESYVESKPAEERKGGKIGEF